MSISLSSPKGTINSYGDLNSCGDCSGGPEDNGTDVLDYMGEAIPKASR